MNKPNLPQAQGNIELPEYIQEQIRAQQQMTYEERLAIIEAQRAADHGKQVPLSVIERRQMIRELERFRLKKSE